MLHNKISVKKYLGLGITHLHFLSIFNLIFFVSHLVPLNFVYQRNPSNKQSFGQTSKFFVSRICRDRKKRSKNLKDLFVQPQVARTLLMKKICQKNSVERGTVKVCQTQWISQGKLSLQRTEENFALINIKDT